MKEYVEEYIIPVIPADKKGKNIKFDFMNAKRLIRCEDCARNPIDGNARTICPCPMDRYMGDEGYCSKAEPK